MLAIDDEDVRNLALESYAPYMRGPLAEPALRASRDIRDEPSRARAIRALAPLMSEPLLAEALAEAGRIADTAERNELVGLLVDYLPDGLLGQALSLVQAMTNESGSARLLIGASPSAPEPDRTALISEALSSAHAAGGGLARAQALGDVAGVLAGAQRAQVLDEALLAAAAIPHDFGRAYAVDYLIPRFGSARRKEVIAEAFAFTRAMPDGWLRACWLAQFARYLPRPERPAVMAEALETARSLPSELQRMDALCAITVHFPGDERVAVFKEAVEFARSHGERLPPQGTFLLKAATFVPDGLVLRTVELVRRALCDDSQLTNLNWILKVFPGQMIEEAITLSRPQYSGLQTAHLFGTIALYAPEQFRHQVIGLALDADERVVARRALMTQAQLLWQGRIRLAELEVLRRTLTGLGIDDYLNVLAAALGIVTQVAGDQAVGDCLAAFRTIQRWWPPKPPEERSP